MSRAELTRLCDLAGANSTLARSNAGHLSPEPIVRPTILKVAVAPGGAGATRPSEVRYVTHTSARALGIMTSSVTQTGRERMSIEGAGGQSTTLNLAPASSTVVAIGVFCGRCTLTPSTAR